MFLKCEESTFFSGSKQKRRRKNNRKRSKKQGSKSKEQFIKELVKGGHLDNLNSN